MSSDKSSIIEKAQKLAAKGQIDKAIEEWQKLIAETPNDGNIYNTIGDLHLKANHSDDAIKAYLKAAEAFKEAGFELKSIAVLKKIVKVDPSRMEVYEKLADIHAERGLTGNAVEDYLKVAKHHAKQGDFRSSLSVYRKMANLDPQNAGIRLKMAEVCQKQGLNKEAIEEYENVLTIFKSKQMVSEAEGVIERILRIDPNYEDGDRQTAAEPSQLNPSQPLILEPIEGPQPALVEPPPAPSLSLSEKMEKTLREGDWEGAEKIFKELEESPVDLFRFLSKWVDYYLENGSLPQAFLVLEKAVSVLDGDSIEEAIPPIRRYLQKDPQHISAYELLGQSLKKLGREKEAADCYSKVISLLLEQGLESDAKTYYEKIKSTLPGIAQERKWVDQFEPHPVAEPLPIEIISEKLEQTPSHHDMESLEPVHSVPSGTDREKEDVSSEISEATFQGHLTEAEVYMKYGLVSKAIEQLLLLSDLAPSREEPHFQLKEIYFKEGMTEKAVQECWILARLYERKGDEGKRKAVLDELVIIDPEGQYQEEKVEKKRVSTPEEGAPFAERLEGLSPERESEDVIQEADPLQGVKVKMAQVEEYLKEGEREAARALLWKILEEDSGCKEARLKLLDIQESSKDSAVASGAPPQQETVEPASTERVDESSFEGLAEELERSFSSLISKDSDEASLLNEEAMDEISGASGATEEREDYVDLASIFGEELKDKEEEADEVDEFDLENSFMHLQRGSQEKRDQEEFETHYNLGIAYKEMGLIPEAIKEFELAFQGEARFQDASSMLASCYKEKGMIDTAIEILQNALEDPRCKKENVLALKYELASIYDLKGVKDKAKLLYEEIHRLDPDFRDISAKKSALGEEQLEQPVSSAREERRPKRGQENKKKNRISYL